MSGESPRRRLRLRRKRRSGSSDSKQLIGPKRRDVATESSSLVRDAAEEVVFRTGCCLLEAVVSAFALFALLSVPAYLLLKVT